MPAKGNYLSFAVARAIVRKLKLRSNKEWKAWSKSGQRPSNIPSNPHQVYRDDGWISMPDWLGYGSSGGGGSQSSSSSSATKASLRKKKRKRSQAPSAPQDPGPPPRPPLACQPAVKRESEHQQALDLPTKLQRIAQWVGVAVPSSPSFLVKIASLSDVMGVPVPSGSVLQRLDTLNQHCGRQAF